MSNKSSLRWKLEDVQKNPKINLLLGNFAKLDAPAKKVTEVNSGKKSKYHNVKCEYKGIRFDSHKERDRYIELLSLKQAGEVVEIGLQPKFVYNILYQRPISTNPLRGEIVGVLSKTAAYIADFAVTYKDGHVEIEDVKGIRTAIYKRKKKIIETLYGINIIEK